jgi:DNA-binding transcriptional regulator GbsR (MarR family)
MKLTPTIEKYILHWGEMGTRWGTNRTVAQIHALLYLSPEPLPADEIARLLSVARSNVSTSIRELQSFGIVKIVHVLGDRRDHFEAVHDLWELFMQVLRERKRREIDPTLTILRECILEAESDKQADEKTVQRIQAMLTFMENMTDWYEQVSAIPKKSLVKLMKLGSKVSKFVSAKD